jgi:hypothetical protein
MHRQGGGNLREGEHRRKMPKTKKYLTSPSERAIPYHANYELPEMFIPYDAPFLIAQ